MSGGSFGYGCFRISDFANDLQEKIDNNNVKDEYGDADNINEDCLELIRTAQKIIETAGKLAYAIEWMYSGDTDQEDLKVEIGKILGGVQ